MSSSGGGFQALEVLAALAFQRQAAFWACTTVGLSAPCCALFIKILDQAIAFFLLEQLPTCQEYRVHLKCEAGREGRRPWEGRDKGCPGEFVLLPCYSVFPWLLCALYLKTPGTHKLAEHQAMAQDTAE